MFRHSSKLIKLVANGITALGIILSIAFGLVIINGNGLKLAGHVLIPARLSMPVGIAVIALGAILSWVAGLLMYGFGELLQKTKDNNYLLSRIAAHTKDLHDQRMQ